MNRRKSKRLLNIRQRGAAILVVTILLLLVATIGTLMIGRVGLMEQKVSGTDVRSKEVYSAAIGGLEYARDWFKDNATGLHWNDADGDGLAEAGDTLGGSGPNPALAATALNADTYNHTFVMTRLTDYNDYVDADGNFDLTGAPNIVRIDSIATAQNDSHITKTVSVEVMMGRVPLFGSGVDPGGTGDITNAPPILIEGCTDDSNTITGQPDVVYNHPAQVGIDPNSVAIGTTSGMTDRDGDGDVDQDDLNDCINIEDIEAHLNLCNDDGDCDDADAFVAAGGEFRDGLETPQSLWTTIFGENTEADLREMERMDPTHFLVVDSSYPHYAGQPSWNGNTWHTNLPLNFNGPPSDSDRPVVLYFDSTVGCPPINGSTEIYGLVYFETIDCGNQGWGGGVIYGTMAKAGDLSKLNANAVIVDTNLDFQGSGEDGGTGSGSGDGNSSGIPKFSEIPGTWRDY